MREAARAYAQQSAATRCRDTRLLPPPPLLPGRACCLHARVRGSESCCARACAARERAARRLIFHAEVAALRAIFRALPLHVADAIFSVYHAIPALLLLIVFWHVAYVSHTPSRHAAFTTPLDVDLRDATPYATQLALSPYAMICHADADIYRVIAATPYAMLLRRRLLIATRASALAFCRYAD